MKRNRNEGLRKVCDCPRRAWAKCPHQWHFNYKWDGVSHRFSLDRHLGRRLTGKSEARREAERLRTAIREGRFGKKAAPATLTIAHLFTQYEKEHLRTKLNQVNNRYQIAAINRTPIELPVGGARPFGEWPIGEVNKLALDRLKAARSEQVTVRAKARANRGEDPKEYNRTVGGIVTANRNLSLLRSMLNWAVRCGLIDATPFKRGTETVVRLTPEAPRRRRLESQEADALLGACGPRLRGIVEAAIETGCRRGELLSLQWWQVRTISRPELVLPASKTKTRRDRVVPISSRLRAVLELRRNAPDGSPQPPGAFVFGDEVGRPVASIKTAWRLACRRAGLEDLHFHDLRREAGSRWLEGGVPLQIVRDWLGHTNVAQTSTYLASTLQGQHDAMSRFEAVRAGLQQTATEVEKRGDHPPLTETIANDEQRRSIN